MFKGLCSTGLKTEMDKNDLPSLIVLEMGPYSTSDRAALISSNRSALPPLRRHASIVLGDFSRSVMSATSAWEEGGREDCHGRVEAISRV